MGPGGDGRSGGWQNGSPCEESRRAVGAPGVSRNLVKDNKQIKD